MMSNNALACQVGAVVIGRNEGQRLRLCITSIIDAVERLVYVDSGSTDGSVALARAMGAEVVELDTAVSFTAARARNAGIERLLRLQPDTVFAQMIDGDCEVVAGWLQAACAAALEHPEVAVIFGRRRERYRDRTIYNRLCDMEWEQPTGYVKSSGGDMLIRVQAFNEVGGFNTLMIAGEEPELSFRLRQRDWDVLCIDHDMTIHDAAMTRFSQFWKRTVRAGHAFAENAWLHGASAERHCVRNVLSSVFWGVGLPLFALVLAWPTGGATLLLLLVGYMMLFFKVRVFRIRHGDNPSDAALYACFMCLVKFIEPVGMAQFVWNRKILGKQPQLIEYKGAR